MNRFNSVADFSPSIDYNSSSSYQRPQTSLTSSQQRPNLKCYPIEIDSLLLNSISKTTNEYSNQSFKSNNCFQTPKKSCFTGFSVSSSSLHKNELKDTDSLNNFSNFRQNIQKPIPFLPSIYNTSQHQKATSLKTTSSKIPNYLPSSVSYYKCEEKPLSNSLEASNFLSKSFSITSDINQNYSSNYELKKLDSGINSNSRFSILSNNSLTTFDHEEKRFALEITNPSASATDTAVWKSPSMLKQNYKSYNNLTNTTLLKNANDSNYKHESTFKSIQKPFSGSNNDLRINFATQNKTCFLKKKNSVSSKISHWRSNEMKFIDDDNKDGNVIMIEREDDCAEDSKNSIYSVQPHNSLKKFNNLNSSYLNEFPKNYINYKNNMESLTASKANSQNNCADLPKIINNVKPKKIFYEDSSNKFSKSFDTNNNKIKSEYLKNQRIPEDFAFKNIEKFFLKNGTTKEGNLLFSKSLDSSSKNKNCSNKDRQNFILSLGSLPLDDSSNKNSINDLNPINSSAINLGLTKNNQISMNDSGISTNMDIISGDSQNSFFFDSSSSGFLEDDDSEEGSLIINNENGKEKSFEER